jgi:hypothetical protein
MQQQWSQQQQQHQRRHKLLQVQVLPKAGLAARSSSKSVHPLLLLHRHLLL